MMRPIGIMMLNSLLRTSNQKLVKMNVASPSFASPKSSRHPSRMAKHLRKSHYIGLGDVMLSKRCSGTLELIPKTVLGLVQPWRTKAGNFCISTRRTFFKQL